MKIKKIIKTTLNKNKEKNQIESITKTLKQKDINSFEEILKKECEKYK